IWSMRLAHCDNRIADPKLRVMDCTCGILCAENLLRTEGPSQEIDHLRRALRMQVWRDRVHSCGQRLGIHAMRRDVPMVTERVLPARLAVAIILVGRLSKRSRAGLQCARVTGIGVCDE